MLFYIFRRILVFIPTLVAISLLAFIISVNAPGDPVEQMVRAAQTVGEVSSRTANLLEQEKFWRKKLGLDLPVFYFSISNLASPDSLHKVFDKNERYALERLIDRYGNWKEISDYYHSLLQLEQANKSVFQDTALPEVSENEAKEALNTASFEAVSLRTAFSDKVIEAKMETLSNIYKEYAFFSNCLKSLNRVKKNHENIKQYSSAWKIYVPAIHFYTINQYHRWIFGDGNWLTGNGSEHSKGIIRGDFGTSYYTQQPVNEKIGEKIFWSLMLTLISVFFAYLVSIPIGIKAAVNKGSKFDRISAIVLFILYSMPSFWVAVLLLMLFANPDVFSDHVALLPASGVKPVGGYPEGAGILEKIRLSLPYLILPTICYTYSSFAFLSRMMRVSMLEVVSQDYIRTARAKGLPERKVIYKHGLRNALLPIITVFANIFPLAIGGSVILESIFTIPGMGNEIYQAILNQDYPMIIAVFTLTGVFTMLGFLVSDILYAIVDPRISFK